MKPSVGRIVHFVLERGARKGECRAAIIVKTWPQTKDARTGLPDGRSNLQVFIDGTSDDQLARTPYIVYKTAIVRSETVLGGQWHWPSVCEHASDEKEDALNKAKEAVAGLTATA